MNKEDFEIIITKLKDRISACDETLGLITETNPIENITVAQLKAIKTFAAGEYKRQTNILLVDCYHVIGMGNLSAVQLGVFTKLIKQYSAYRPDLNAILRWDGDIDDLPKIPKRTKFKLLELGVELVSGRSGEIEESSIEDTAEQLEDPNATVTPVSTSGLVPVGKFVISLNSIVIKPEEVEPFSNFIINHRLFKTMMPDVLQSKILAQQTYCGIFWHLVDGKFIGTPINKSVKKSIKEFYKNFDCVVDCIV